MAPTASRRAARIVSLALVVAMLHASAARAVDAEVADGAGFFSPETLSEAREMILAIGAAHDRDVRVETYADVPEPLRARLERDGQDKFFDDWLNRRAKALGVRGVFVLVTRTPGRVQVGVDQATERRAFTADDREALRDALATAFRAGRYDRGLLDGLRFVRRRMDENTSRGASPSVPVAGASGE
jgi:uncharacterized membrane protein YgcG